MCKIKLKGLKFHAFHGVYKEEQKNGNIFFVDVTIKTNLEKPCKSDNLIDTADYVQVFEAVKAEMKIPSKLLENVAYRINQSLSKFIPKSKIKTTIYKMNPPFDGICKYSSVTLKIKT